MRLVSLVPSLTETACELGGREVLAGCTAFCTRPAGLLKDARIVVVGGTKTVLREKVLALQPDHLLMNWEENRLEDIEFFRSRVPTYINGTKTLEDGLRSIEDVGALIGGGAVERARTLVARGLALRAELGQRVQEQLAAGRPRPRLLYLIWREPWMSVNADTFIHDHLTAWGAVNVCAGKPARYPELSLEEIRAAQPDVVWLPSEPYIFKEKHRAEWINLPGLPAAQTGRVELVDGEAVCWFGVRQLEGMQATFEQLWRSADTEF